MSFHQQLHKPQNIAPLASLRVLLGLVFSLAIFRTWWYGWIEKFYLQPKFFFPLTGFEWLPHLPDWGFYALFGLLFLAAQGILWGYAYRLAALIFCLGFSYLELLDLTHYLNHYYLLSLLSFLLCFVPADRSFSLRTWLRPQERWTEIPRWSILLFQIQIFLVYWYAGWAKCEKDWLLEALPMRIWLLQRSDFPVLGPLFTLTTTAYLFSWFGFLYDVSIGFFLWWKRSRLWAFAAVIVFHVLTRLLFPIGVFPLVMIGLSTIFFSGQVHEKIQKGFSTIFILTLSKLKLKKPTFASENSSGALPQLSSWQSYGLGLYLLWQVLFPLRFWVYGRDVNWHEAGFRFAWRVMLMEKTGDIQFRVVDIDGREAWVENRQFLRAKQEVMMRTQPDMILQFAHFLAAHHQEQLGFRQPKVFAESFVSMNGRPSQRFIPADLDLCTVSPWWPASRWVLPRN